MGQDTNLPTSRDKNKNIASKKRVDTAGDVDVDVAGTVVELAELQKDLSKVQAATVSGINKTLSTISLELQKLNLVVNTQETRISIAQEVSSFADECISKLTRIFNTSDSEGYKTIILAKQEEATEMKSTADAYISENVDEKDKVTPFGSTSNLLYQDAKATTGGYEKKF